MHKKIDYQKKIITVPNILSAFRLCLIPVIVWLYCVQKDYLWTTVVLVLSGLTDIVDGFIARRFHMISDLGKALDPIADKLTQAAMLFCLVTRFPFMWIPLTLLIVKVAFVGITSLLTIHKTKIVLGADWHGKIATVVLYAMMLVHLVWYEIPAICSNILIGICMAVMLLSLAIYGIRNVRILTEK